MARWWVRLSRWFGTKAASTTQRAAAAEARGDLELAIQYYLEAGAADDAARVLAVRAECAHTGQERLRFLSLAVAHAGNELRGSLLRRQALLKLELTQQRSLFLTRDELSRLGRELESLGEHRVAADAYGLAGDIESQTAALVEVGAIERLEAVFDADDNEKRAERERERVVVTASDLERTGKRRAALALATDQPENGHPRLREIVHRIQSRRVLGRVIDLEVEGRAHRFVLGDAVTLGRADAGIVVASPAVSRAHLELARRDGVSVVRDISRSGTSIGGVPLAGPLEIRGAMSLELGGAVRVELMPHDDFGVSLALGEQTYFVPLGPLSLEVGRFQLGTDDWVEFVPGPKGAYLGALQVTEPVQLCRGDALRNASEGGCVKVLG